MSQSFRPESIADWAGLQRAPSEVECHTEHREALDATVFQPEDGAQELIFELAGGQLRVRATR